MSVYLGLRLKRRVLSGGEKKPHRGGCDVGGSGVCGAVRVVGQQVDTTGVACTFRP